MNPVGGLMALTDTEAGSICDLLLQDRFGP